MPILSFMHPKNHEHAKKLYDDITPPYSFIHYNFDLAKRLPLQPTVQA